MSQMLLNEEKDLILLEVLSQELKDHLERVLILISRVKQNSPHLKQMNAQVKLLFQLIDENSLDEKQINDSTSDETVIKYLIFSL